MEPSPGWFGRSEDGTAVESRTNVPSACLGAPAARSLTIWGILRKLSCAVFRTLNKMCFVIRQGGWRKASQRMSGGLVAGLMWGYIVNLNKLLRTALKTGLYFLEQSDKATAPIRKQVKDQAEVLTDRTRQAILGPEDHTVRNAVSLAAGTSLGIALGMLFAPASGEEIRRSIVEKAQDAREKVRGRFSAEKGSTAADAR
jgi:hypothetical protein